MYLHINREFWGTSARLLKTQIVYCVCTKDKNRNHFTTKTTPSRYIGSPPQRQIFALHVKLNAHFVHQIDGVFRPKMGTQTKRAGWWWKQTVGSSKLCEAETISNNYAN